MQRRSAEHSVVKDDERNDHELAQAAARGDEEARRLVAQRAFDRVRTTVRYLAGNRPNALDLVQECLVEILRSLGSFRGESRLETWADRIAVRTAMRRIRRDRDLPEAAGGDLHHLTSAGEDPERVMSQTQLRNRMAALLGKLSPERRQAVVLMVVYGYTAPEVAEMTETNLHTVRDRVKVGRQQLRRLILTDSALREWAEATSS